MGVLNVTPDSFSDGGRYASLEDARRRGAELAAAGADLIDIGGESTRPGAPTVSTAEELDRVLPVVEALRRETAIPLSIDTSKAAVARAAMAAGAEFINDISGLHFDPEMAATVAAGGAGLFLMHTRGRPDRMQQDTRYEDLLGEILASLREALAVATAAGIPEEKLAVDPWDRLRQGCGGKSGNPATARGIALPGTADPPRHLAQELHRTGTRPARSGPAPLRNPGDYRPGGRPGRPCIPGA